jgi:hypothetical protein
VKKFFEKIRNYFIRAESYSFWRFILEITLVTFILKSIPAFVLALIYPEPAFDPIQEILTGDLLLFEDFLFLIILIIFLVPIFETLFGQIIPIKVIGIFTNSNIWKIVLSGIFFALLHGYESFLIILPVAFIFSWSFIIWGKKSFWKGFSVTSIIHGLHNLIATALTLIIF